jgi:hypothetical protein
VQRARLGLAVLTLLLASACASATAAGGPATTATVLPCAKATLTVGLVSNESTVRVVNAGRQACQLAGRYAVTMPWWRVQGAGSEPASGTLQPGASYLQPYRAVASNGCPYVPGDQGKTRTLVVSVENREFELSMNAWAVRVILNCTVVAAEPARVVAP